MKIKEFIRIIYVLLMMVAGVISCINENRVNLDGDTEGGYALVKLEVRIPGNAIPTTRALLSQHEDEVSEVIVLAFEKGSGSNWDTELVHVGKSLGVPQSNGALRQFMVELYSGEWDLWVLGNAEDLVENFAYLIGDIDPYSEEFVSIGLKKSDFQAGIIKTSTGKWSVNPNDANKSYLMPMWGVLDGVQIQNSSTNIIRTVNLYRMSVKIDVEVQRTEDTDDPTTYPGIPLSQFELTYVSLHNYNTVGRLAPGITTEDGNWTSPDGGVALKPSLPQDPGGVYGYNNRLEWSDQSDFTTDATALAGVIYTFEADSGTHSNNRPCIIIGGKYNGSDEVSYYRMDFVDTDGNYMDLLRNHKYKFLIRKVGGRGFPSVEDAYVAGPTNIEAKVIEWNEGNYLEGIWSGTYEIRMSARRVHFTQFGEPDEQQIMVRSNVPSLTFDGFSNITSAPGDDVWEEIDVGVWSNDHFTVTIEKVAEMGEYSDYAITVNANPTEAGDPDRTSIFHIKGYMLQVVMEISQDSHSQYQLQTSPDASYAIGIDGTAQRVKINITSTHPYKVDFMSYTMFDGVYEVATGGNPINQANIPSSTSELYIAVKAHEGEDARVGEFYIQHLDNQSNAPARVYSVLQMTPIIIAELEEGGISSQVSKQGGSKTIKISSNLAGWYPVLYIDDVQISAISSYFDIVTGVKNQDIIFTAPALSAGVTSDVVYKIKFIDANNKTETANFITITQKIMNGTPPTGGTPATEYILAVDSNGELNLDGRGYIVFFKWGSTVAISGSSSVFSSDQIAWAPDNYNISVIGNDWSKVPFADGVRYPTSLPPDLPTEGLGDPCKLASKDGVKGGWKMPPASIFGEVGGWTTRTIQNIRVNGRTATATFYPAAGRWMNGTLDEPDITGYYWSSEPRGTNVAASLYFQSGTIMTGYSVGRAVASPIRCIQE